MEIKKTDKINAVSFDRLMEGLLLSIGLFGCVLMAFKPVDTDLFFIISNGRQIFETGNLFPSVLVTSTHPNLPTVIQQPLYSLLVYLVYSKVGFMVGPVMGGVLASLTLIIVHLIFRGVHSPVVSALCTCLIVLLSSQYFRGRPSGISIVFMSLSILVLERVLSGANRYLIFLLIPLSLLELICHASFYPMFLLICAFYLLELLITSDFKSAALLFSSMAISGIISFFTPYGSRLPLYLFYSYKTADSLAILELARAQVLSIYGLVIIGAVLLFVYTFKGVPLFRILMYLSGILFLAMHIRNMFLLCVFAIPYIYFIAARHFSNEPSDSSGIFPFALAAGVFVICFVCFSGRFLDTAVSDNSSTPVLAADYLSEHGANRIFTSFNSGGYLEFRGFRVYIDARPELYSKKLNCTSDIISEYVDLCIGYGFDYEAFLDYHGFDYMVVDIESHFCEYLLYNGYSPVFTGNGYHVFKGDVDE